MLPAEAEEREVVSRRIADVFSAWGFGLVETPVVEDLAALEAAAGSLQGTAFRLIDLDGRLLALRPDMTVPIARLSASRLADQPGPHRFRYAAEVFREQESLRGQARQFTQAGIELVGEGGAAADAEVVAVLVEALEAARIPEFTVAVGTVAVLHALLAAADGGPDWSRAVLAAAHERDLVALDRLAREATSPQVVSALSTVPRLRGGREAIEACRNATTGLGCESVLNELAATWDLLDAAGVTRRVVIDFSVMRSFDYYTGLVVEAYARGVGLPLGGGGRYDGVLAAYGAPTPAAGFALGLERIMIALVEQGQRVDVRGLDALVGGDPALALPTARKLRRLGKRVALSAALGEELVAEAIRFGAREAMLAQPGGRFCTLDAAGKPILRFEEEGGR
ncbi:MAG: ATP phosphoribosyltransferase regulatory subunit [Coriobacteriia bacterium]|nr:ATP phosphoribosyltransferase regulatory subunit [Coriobacteriia bacterium]